MYIYIHMCMYNLHMYKHTTCMQAVLNIPVYGIAIVSLWRDTNMLIHSVSSAHAATLTSVSSSADTVCTHCTHGN